MLPLWRKPCSPWPSWPRRFLFLRPMILRIRIIAAGHSENRSDRPVRRLGAALGKILLQRCTLKNERPFTGLMHVFIFYSALTFDTLTVNHTLEGFFSGFSLLGHGRFRMFFALLTDVMAVLVVAGTLYFIVRRFLLRPKAYRTTPLDSAVIYAFLILVTASFLYYEAFAIAARGGARGVRVPRQPPGRRDPGSRECFRRPSRPTSTPAGGSISCWSSASSPMSPIPSISTCSPARSACWSGNPARAGSSRPWILKTPRRSGSKKRPISPGRTISTPSPAWSAADARTPARRPARTRRYRPR